VKQALGSDEHVVQLAPALKSAQAKAVRLLIEVVKPLPPTAAPPPPKPKPGRRIVEQGSQQNLDLTAAKDLLIQLGSKMRTEQTIRLDLEWIIEDEDSST